MGSRMLALCSSLSRSAQFAGVLEPLSAWISNPIKTNQFPVVVGYCKASQQSDGGEKESGRPSSVPPDEDLKTKKPESLTEAERAPSTAEEFKRVAEEKLKEAEKGVASQTADKAFQAAEEATFKVSDLESNKKRFKQHGGGAAAGDTDKSDP